MNKLKELLKKILMPVAGVSSITYFWFESGNLVINESLPFYSVTSRLLFILLVLLIGGFVFYQKKIKPLSDEEKQNLLNKFKINNLHNLIDKVRQYAYDLAKSVVNLWQHRNDQQLIKLPWYLVIGPKASGKSTLIQHGGLDAYEFNAPALSPWRLDCADDYRWFHSQQAVFLEISGTQETDLDAQYENYWSLNAQATVWQRLKQLTRFYRPFRALNGVIVTLPLTELLLQTEMSAQAKKAALVKLLESLSKRFKQKLPIYFMLSKCDVVAGFSEFFQSLSSEAKQQPLGFVIDYHGHHAGDLSQVFNKEYNHLLAKLNHQLLQFMQVNNTNLSNAAWLYLPQQLSLCQKPLAEYANLSSSYALRAVNFVSCHQQGKTFDFLMSAINRKYDLSHALPEMAASGNRSYFSKEILPAVILPDQAWVSRTSQFLKINLRNYRSQWYLAGSGLLIAGIILFFSYQRNEENLFYLRHSLPSYRQTISKVSIHDDNLTAVLPMFTILENYKKLYIDADNKFSLRFELAGPWQIERRIDKAYQRILVSEFLPRFSNYLHALLKKNNNPPEEQYQFLKQYLALGHKQFQPMIARTLLTTSIDDGLYDKNDRVVLNQLVSDALTKSYERVTLDNALIASVRQRLQHAPIEMFIYDEIKTKNASAKNYNPAQSINHFRDIFTLKQQNSALIPTFYTFNGYHRFYKNKLKDFSKEIEEVNQVLGKDLILIEEYDVKDMKPLMKAKYENDYIVYWRAFLNNVQIKPAKNLSHAIHQLSILTSYQSPLKKLLSVVNEQTFPFIESNASIAQHFAEINSTVSLPAKLSSNPYEKLNKDLLEIKKYFISLDADPNYQQKEFQDILNILTNKEQTNPIMKLKVHARVMPWPLNNWLDQLADSYLNILFQGAHQVIQNVWYTNVLPNYKDLIQGRFPFDAHSELYVPLDNFTQAFGGKGVFNTFIQKYIQPFVVMTDSHWQFRSIGNARLPLSDANLYLLHNLWAISRAYYPNNDNNLGVQFTIRPRVLDSKADSINLQIGNQTLVYRHGPQQAYTLRWPVKDDMQQVSVSINSSKDQSHSKHFEGVWAWLMLLNASNMEVTSNPGHYIWTISLNNYKASFDIHANNSMPLFDVKMMQNLRLPDEI